MYGKYRRLGIMIDKTNHFLLMVLRCSMPTIKKMTGSTNAEYFVYRANAVNIPASRKWFILSHFMPLAKKKIAAIKNARKVASLNPEREKKKKYSVMMKNMTA